MPANIIHKISTGIWSVVSPPLAKIFPYPMANLKNLLVEPPSKKKGYPMIYPYTLTAKLAQFPWNYHCNHGWNVKYLLIGTVCAIPFFHFMSSCVNTRENKRFWKELRKEWYGDHSQHHAPHHDDGGH